MRMTHDDTWDPIRKQYNAGRGNRVPDAPTGPKTANQVYRNNSHPRNERTQRHHGGRSDTLRNHDKANIPCRFTPCTNQNCPFLHMAQQQQFNNGSQRSNKRVTQQQQQQFNNGNQRCNKREMANMPCRYAPCTNQNCPYLHRAQQQQFNNDLGDPVHQRVQPRRVSNASEMESVEELPVMVTSQSRDALGISQGLFSNCRYNIDGFRADGEDDLPMCDCSDGMLPSCFSSWFLTLQHQKDALQLRANELERENMLLVAENQTRKRQLQEVGRRMHIKPEEQRRHQILRETGEELLLRQKKERQFWRGHHKQRKQAQ